MRKDIRDYIMKQVEELIHVSPEDGSTKLADIGFDSFAFIQLLVNIEERYNIEFPDEKLTFEELITVDKISELVEQLINKA